MTLEGMVNGKSLQPGQIQTLHMWVHPEWFWGDRANKDDLHSHEKYIRMLALSPRDALLLVPSRHPTFLDSEYDGQNAPYFKEYVDGLRELHHLAQELLGRRYGVWDLNDRFVRAQEPEHRAHLIKMFKLRRSSLQDYEHPLGMERAKKKAFLGRVQVYGRIRNVCPAIQAYEHHLQDISLFVENDCSEIPNGFPDSYKRKAIDLEKMQNGYLEAEHDI